MPTVDQAMECVYVCHMLSNLYRDIAVFRYDSETKEVYILAGDEIQVVISATGRWRFV